jgi:methionyl-tRNA formyltransferase
VTGVTAHYVTEEVDRGDILLQRAIEIGDDENDGQLRRRLAAVAAGMIPELISMFAAHQRPRGQPQGDRTASQAPRPSADEGRLHPNMGVDLIRRKMRALNPLPGTSIEVGGRWVAVSRFALRPDSRGAGIYDSAGAVDVVADTGAIRLFKCEGVSPSRS